MSNNKEENKEIIEEGVVVEEATEVMVSEGETKESKKAKYISIAKNVGKVLGYVLAAGIGFAIGKSVSGRSEDNEPEIIEVDYDIDQPNE